MDTAPHLSILTNALGHVAGVVVFGAFLWLIFRAPMRRSRAETAAPGAAAALALSWNLGSLIVVLGEPNSALSELVASLSFTVLSLLPSVLLHLALGREHPRLRAGGYAIGGLAAAAHLAEAFGLGIAGHDFGIRLITFGFGALSVGAAALLSRGRAARSAAGMRTVTAMALFLLAASFVHFGAEHGPGSWGRELIFHHAGMPLALFVLLQDFRFLLLDVFVRVVGAAVFSAGLAAALLTTGNRLGLLQFQDADAVRLVVFVVLTCAAILGYPYAAGKMRRWAEAALFRRGDVRAAADGIRAITGGGDAFLQAAAKRIARFFSVRHWRLLDAGDGGMPLGAHVFHGQWADRLRPAADSWAEAAVVFRVAPHKARTLLLGPREGGRPYLSGDASDLELLAAAVNDRIDSLRREEQQNLLSETELQALRAQINPHFLFNALNALYGIIPRAAADARKTLANLAEVFRYSLESKRQMAPLDEEMRVVEAYLDIERLRLGNRLSVRVEVEPDARSVSVPALSIQPLVENAVKHGISEKPEGGEVTVRARRIHGDLAVEVIDNGAGMSLGAAETAGHGLRNVRRRLQLCYGGGVELAVEASSRGVRAGFTAPAEHSSKEDMKQAKRYEIS